MAKREYKWFSLCSVHGNQFKLDPQCTACHAGEWINVEDPEWIADQKLFKDDPKAWIVKHNPPTEYKPRMPGETMTVRELMVELAKLEKEYGEGFRDWLVYTEQCNESDKDYKRGKQKWDYFQEPDYPGDPRELWWEYFAVAGFISRNPKKKRISINVNY